MKYEVRRVRTGSEGVYVHRIHPEGKGAQRCECGTMLERKS